MRGSSALPAFTPRMPPQPSSMSCALSKTSTSKPYCAPSSTATSAMADAVRCPGGPLARSRAMAARAAGDDAGRHPRGNLVDVGAVEGQHQLGQRLLGMGRAERGEPVARQQGALGGRLARGRRAHTGRRNPDAEPALGARRGTGGDGHGIAHRGRVERAGRPGTDEDEHRPADAGDDEARADRAVEPGGGQRRPVEVGAQVARQVAVGVHEHGHGVEGRRVEGGHRRDVDIRGLRGNRAVVGGDQQAGVAGHRWLQRSADPTLARCRAPVTGLSDVLRRPGLESRA